MAYVSTQFTPGFRLTDGSQLNQMISQINAGPLSGPTYYVNETLGSDNLNNGGQNPYEPLKTLDRALAVESAALTARGLSSVGRNAVVAFWGTQHRTSTLAWNLPSTHLVGISAGQLRGKRARISVSGTTGFNKLVENSAQGNYFGNFGTFYGWPNTSAALVAWSDTAGRTMYDNVEFLGFGDTTTTTGSSNLTGSRAFVFNSNDGETTWNQCVYGVDTTVRNATNYTVEIQGGAPRLSFTDCVFEADLGSSGGSSSHLLIGVGGIDRYLDLVRCRFHNAASSGATAMSQALNVDVSAGGTVILDQSTASLGITAWQTTPTANVVMNMVAATTTGGKTHVVF